MTLFNQWCRCISTKNWSVCYLFLLCYAICVLQCLQAPHIDKTDFLNVVVREKKRFENTLDDSVAAGLNAGTEVLMNQVRIELLMIVVVFKCIRFFSD